MTDLTDKIERVPWDQYFMLIAKLIALRSTCNSRPGGAVIVKDNRILATGYVGAVKNAPQCTDYGESYCYRRELNIPDYDKYNHCRSVHAEDNAIAYAANFGVSLQGSVLYCTLQPCLICLKKIKASGILSFMYEHAYNSKDNDRDTAWTSKIQEYKLQSKQLTVDDEWLEQACNYLVNITSMRRLAPTD